MILGWVCRSWCSLLSPRIPKFVSRESVLASPELILCWFCAAPRYTYQMLIWTKRDSRPKESFSLCTPLRLATVWTIQDKKFGHWNHERRPKTVSCCQETRVTPYLTASLPLSCTFQQVNDFSKVTDFSKVVKRAAGHGKPWSKSRHNHNYMVTNHSGRVLPHRTFCIKQLEVGLPYKLSYAPAQRIIFIQVSSLQLSYHLTWSKVVID